MKMLFCSEWMHCYITVVLVRTICPHRGREITRSIPCLDELTVKRASVIETPVALGHGSFQIVWFQQSRMMNNLGHVIPRPITGEISMQKPSLILQHSEQTGSGQRGEISCLHNVDAAPEDIVRALP